MKTLIPGIVQYTKCIQVKGGVGEHAIQQTCVKVRGTRLSPLLLFQENDVTKLYMELAAENKQQLSRLEFAKKIVEKVPANSSWQDWGTLDWGLK